MKTIIAKNFSRQKVLSNDRLWENIWILNSVYTTALMHCHDVKYVWNLMAFWSSLWDVHYIAITGSASLQDTHLLGDSTSLPSKTKLQLLLHRNTWKILTRKAASFVTRWRKQCLESGSEKTTRTRYQVWVTFSDWLSEHYRALGLCLVQPGHKPQALFLKQYLHPNMIFTPLVYDLKFVGPLGYELVAPMPEQLKTTTIHFYEAQGNALLWSQFVMLFWDGCNETKRI